MDFIKKQHALDKASSRLKTIIRVLVQEKRIEQSTGQDILEDLSTLDVNQIQPSDIIEQIREKGTDYSEMDYSSSTSPKKGKYLDTGGYIIKIIKKNS